MSTDRGGALPWVLAGGGVFVLAAVGLVLWLVLRGGSLELLAPADGSSVTVGDMAEGLEVSWSGDEGRVTALGRLCLTGEGEEPICPFEIASTSRQGNTTWSFGDVICDVCASEPQPQTLINVANFLAERASGQDGLQWALHWKAVSGRENNVPPIDDMLAVVDIVATPALSTALTAEDLEILGGAG